MAAARMELDPLTDSVTCIICAEVLDDPRCMPCMHSYCRKCIQDIMDKSENAKEIPCPICREVCRIPEQGAAGLKVNFFANSVLDAIKDRSASSSDAWNCDICLQDDKKSPAVSKCVECIEKLCESCVRAHKFSRFTKSHKVLDLSGDTAQDTKAAIDLLSKRTLYCKEHVNEPLKYYCKKDECLICQDCFVIGHQGHPCDNIETTARANQKNLAAVIDLGRQRLDMYDTSINEGHLQKKGIEKNLEDSKAKLNEDRKKIHAKVDAIYDALEMEATTICGASAKNTVGHLADLQFDRDAIENTIKQLENLQQHGHPADIVYMIPEMNAKREVWSIPHTFSFQSAVHVEVGSSHINDGSIIFGNVCEAGNEQADAVYKLDYLLYPLGVLKNDEYVAVHMTMQDGEPEDGIIARYDKEWKQVMVYEDIDLQNDDCKMIITTDECLGVSQKGSNEEFFVKLYNQDGTFQKDIKISTDGLDDMIMNHLNELVILDNTRNTLFYVDYKTGAIIETFKFDANAKSDANVKCIKFELGVNSKNDIIIADNTAQSVRGIGRDGRDLFKYTGQDGELEEVMGLCIDKKDNIIVVHEEKMQVLTPNGHYIRTLPNENPVFDMYLTAIVDNYGDLVVCGMQDDGDDDNVYIAHKRLS